MGGLGYLFYQNGKKRFSEWRRDFLDKITNFDHTPRDLRPLPTDTDYLAFLDNLHLKYFTAKEIIQVHSRWRGDVQNDLPPRELWFEIENTLRIADLLRDRLGVTCKILSAYRSKKYNTAVGGAKFSQHMQNRALDLKFSCSSTKVYEAAMKLREEGLFQGGIGWYPNFVHIDTRGRNVEWGREEG